VFPLKVPKTLRFRLAMWNAGAVAVTAALSIVAVHQATRWAMTHSLDDLLTEDVEEIRLALIDLDFDNNLLRDELNRKAIGHRRHEWFVKLLSEDRTQVWGSVNAPAGLLPESNEPGDLFATSGEYRHFTKPIQDDSPIRWIQVGASMGPLSQELGKIDQIAMFTWLLSLGIAPLLGWLLSGRALRPLRQMVNTASTLRPNRLSDRLPIRDADDELDQLAITINLLLDRIATDVGEKHDFLANAAHELRTPLAAIHATAEVALVTPRSGEVYRDLVAQIIEQTDALSGIVNQLLLLSESSLAPRYDNRKCIALHELVLKSVDIFRAVAESNDVSLRIDRNEKTRIYGNRDQWIQVLNNLIDNAIKYTPRGGRVAIDLRRIENEIEPPFIQLTVSDTGIGIQSDAVHGVFDRFYRADRSRTRLSEVSGTGLGLSICKAVVESHLGTIFCKSQLGLGTVLTIRLPIEIQLQETNETLSV